MVHFLFNSSFSFTSYPVSDYFIPFFISSFFTFPHEATILNCLILIIHSLPPKASSWFLHSPYFALYFLLSFSLVTHSVLLIMIMEVYTTTLTQIGALLSRSKSPAAAPHSAGEGAKHESIIFRIFTTNCLWRGKTVGQRRQPHLDDNKRASHGHRTRWHHFLLPSWPVHPRAPHNFRRRRRRTARLKKLRCKF